MSKLPCSHVKCRNRIVLTFFLVIQPGILTLPAFLRQYRQSFVFVSFHDFAFSGSFIVDAAEVEDAVDDGTVEFFVVGGVEGL